MKALQMGAADFITKPFDMHEVILARVGRIIELSEGRQLISAAEHDPLTMLYNRNFFFEYANRIYTYHPGWKMDAIVMNIEQFHAVNALNGREFGDNVLRLLGNEIRAFLGETEGIASRIEADRFDIYCKHRDDYQALLDRFQDKVNALSYNANIRLRMGVEPWREGVEPWREDVEPILLFDRAHTACNMVRGDYLAHLMVYDEDMRMREILNQRLLNDLQRAVDERQLMVYYQPKYNIQCDPPKLSSAEALIRWKHPELGMISPGDFIPLFESNGQISTVDNYVWVKMDMKFIRNIEHNEKDFRLVELVLDIARYLRVPVVAEGVETETQMNMLKDAGCELVQGYYFSRPLPPEEFEKLIEREIKIDRGNHA